MDPQIRTVSSPTGASSTGRRFSTRTRGRGVWLRSPRGELELLEIFEGPIATEILPARGFYPAEDYHQDCYIAYEGLFK
ncbi:peptide-methionine (S)-S-oxide reductase [Thermococcus sp. JdF3]|uniref:peptide-methionine (S)-S-oxide reductase n=1 Tax=Thermococcus sp. JdF3 TaxID=1638258 RepID=UPI00351B438F